MLAVTRDLHVLRDPTRGGLATSLNEIAAASGVGVRLVERAIPVPPDVAQRLRDARASIRCTSPTRASWSRSCRASTPTPCSPRCGRIRSVAARRSSASASTEHPGMVVATTTFGGTRVVDTPLGEQLPRIC